jgi:hypothetical protein
MKRFWLFGLFLAGTLVALNAPAFAKDATDSQDSQDMADAMDDVNSALGSMAIRVSNIEDQLKLKFFGDVRARFAFLGQSQSALPVTSATTIQPQWLARVRARLGASKQFGDFSAALRLSTGSDNNMLSENQTLGLESAEKWIGLDQAYLTWTPSFAMGHFKTTVGKMGNPLTNTPISWDPDPQPEGLLLEGSMDDAKLRATYFILNDSSGVTAATNEDLYMAWFQAEQNIKVDADTSVLLTLGYEFVPNVSALNGTGPLAPGAPSNPTGGAFKTPVNLGMVTKGATGLIPNINTVEGIIGFKNKIAGIPFKWTLHFMDNLDSFDISPGYTNQYAAYFGITAGDASDKDTLAGTLAAGYIEPNATLSLITDDDSGDNNTEYLRGTVVYGIEKGLQLVWNGWAIDHVYYTGATAFAGATTGGGATSNGLGKTSRDPEFKSFLDLLATF